MSMPSAEVLAGFLRAHGLQLNAQQQAAVGAVEGAVLLLAVPGSGKTTVLVTRLGYLVQCCNVRPEEILTMTYTVAATRDMRSRFSSLFGEELGSRMEFRTINGVSARIIRVYEQRMGRTAFSLLSSEAEQTALLRVLYFRCKGEYPTDAELKQAPHAHRLCKKSDAGQGGVGPAVEGARLLPRALPRLSAGAAQCQADGL